MIREFGVKTTSMPLLAGALVFALAALAGTSVAQETPHLAGTWNFNKDLSDDASQKIQDAQVSAKTRNNYPGAGGSQGGGYPGGGGGGYPGGGGGGGYPGGGGIGFPGGRGGMGGGRGGRGGQQGPYSDGGLSDADMGPLATTSKTLTVEQDEKRVAITDDGGQVKNLYTDGKKHKEKDESGQSSTTKARWEGNRLIVESKLGHSGKLTETYSLSQDGKQLDMISQLDNSRLGSPLVIRRVYDVAAGATK